MPNGRTPKPPNNLINQHGNSVRKSEEKNAARYNRWRFPNVVPSRGTKKEFVIDRSKSPFEQKTRFWGVILPPCPRPGSGFLLKVFRDKLSTMPLPVGSNFLFRVRGVSLRVVQFAESRPEA
jgi:hypothetical protein